MSDIDTRIEAYNMYTSYTFIIYSFISLTLFYLVFEIWQYQITNITECGLYFTISFVYYILCNVLYLVSYYIKDLNKQVLIFNILLSNFVVSTSLLNNTYVIHEYFGIVVLIIISAIFSVLISIIMFIDKYEIHNLISKLNEQEGANKLYGSF